MALFLITRAKTRSKSIELREEKTKGLNRAISFIRLNRLHPSDLSLIVSLISGFTFITLAREEGRALFFRGVQFIKSVP